MNLIKKNRSDQIFLDLVKYKLKRLATLKSNTFPSNKLNKTDLCRHLIHVKVWCAQINLRNSIFS